MTDYRALFEAELARHDVAWCRGCDLRSSHRRGFATAGTVHYDAEIQTRSTFYGGLHEIGHVVLGHNRRGRKRRFEIEAEAERWAQKRMREFGVPVPRGEVAAGRAYVDRMRRHGNASRHRHTWVRRTSGDPEMPYICTGCNAVGARWVWAQ